MASVPMQPHLNQLVLSVLEKCSHLNHLKQLQGFLISLGHSQTQFYAFKLVRFCNLTLTDLCYSRFIFDHLSSPNVYLYTAMITAYASEPDSKAAFLLYRNMVRRGAPLPNHFIYPHVLKSCPELLESNGTKMVHAQVLKSGFGGYPVVQTAIVDAYSRFRTDIGIARQVFDEMLERSVVSWTAMISGYARLGDIDNAMALFESMPERDIPAWNALIAGCAQNGFFCEAIGLFKRMVSLALEGNKERETKPNKITVASALSSCGHTGMLHLGKWIHGYVFKTYLGQDSFISNALLDMYGKCGNLKVARRVFDMITLKSLTSWNSLINCLALHGHSGSAIDLFLELVQCRDGVQPDAVTFVGVLNACTHGGLVEKGYSYFKMMRQDYDIEPQIEHFGCLIDLLGRAGRFEEAMEVVRGMNIEPDEVVWGSLLNGCKIHGRLDLAEYSVKKLIEMDPENGGYRIMLANIYAELENWDEVRKVRKLLKEQNAYKIPGCSWIEVDNHVYQFYSFDMSHPNAEQIYKTLESMIIFM
ncbi:pentatricopeptide repeat-containing protein At1g33350 [Cucurbita maxima]|uniref:Pentatricopeptide repeat-containing protein At1g33350 n=1 Tax=Cucurbita maxima TaxID=3661 RepID=A0A6J1IF22_CUCMA|nr:pentatricopeptide repeat-containing protein At1g33350 [Cucurbita maxima]